MKKILALILSLCLLCGAAALAENTKTTEIYYEMAANETYTVTIPAALNLSGAEEGRPTGYMDVKIEAADFNVPGKTVSVTLTAAGFKLVNGESDMPYIIEMDGSAVALNDLIAAWTFGDEAASKQLRVHVTSLDNALVAGKYTDTLTFTLGVNGGM